MFEKYLHSDSWIISAVQLARSSEMESLVFVVHAAEGLLEVIQRIGSTGVYAYDSAPGARWTCSEFVRLIEEPGEKVTYTEVGSAKLTVDIFKIDWFLPMVRRMAQGVRISYEEADRVYRDRFNRALRLYPANAPSHVRNEFELQLDYNYDVVKPS